MLTIDKYSYTSRLRYHNANLKFVYAIMTLLFCVITRSISVACTVFILNGILTIGFGKIPWFVYLKLWGIPLGFLLLSTLAIMINVSSTPMNGYAISLGSWYLTASQEGLLRALQLILTALASVSSLYFLSLNTPMTDQLLVLRMIRCPALIRELMMLIYRFIFILLTIASQITIAQNSRLGNCSLRQSFRSFSAMLGALFAKSLKQADAVYNAMESRCYDGTIQVLIEHEKATAGEIAGVGCVFLFLLALTVL